MGTQEKHDKLTIFERNIMRKILGPTRSDDGYWRIKTNQEINDILKGQNITGFINPLSPELNPICYLLVLLAHDFLHVSRITVKSLTLRLLTHTHTHIYQQVSGLWPLTC
jgi:transposase